MLFLGFTEACVKIQRDCFDWLFNSGFANPIGFAEEWRWTLTDSRECFTIYQEVEPQRDPNGQLLSSMTQERSWAVYSTGNGGATYLECRLLGGGHDYLYIQAYSPTIEEFNTLTPDLTQLLDSVRPPTAPDRDATPTT